MPVRYALLALLCGGLLAAQIAPRFDAAHLDRTVSPCTDFYQYACGGWMAANPVPADLSLWGRLQEVAERNRVLLREILEKDEGKSGAYYAACMDLLAVEERGLEPIEEDLKRIAAIQDRPGFALVVARLHRVGAGGVFRFDAAADMKDSSRNIAVVDQGGLTLPDRDYYLKDDDRSTALREAYEEHVRKTFALLGAAPEEAAARARAVLEIETALAQGSLDRVTRRDPARRYYKMTRHELGSLAPEFGWDRYFEAAGAPAFDSLNIAAPPFLRRLDELLNRRPREQWKAYLTWRLVHSQAENLPAAFREEDFAFFGRRLMGRKEPPARWKQCVAAVDRALGEDLGRKYVERAFGARDKERTVKMVEALEKALEKDIAELPWMSAATRRQAIAKLRAVTNKIGYPERWRDYSALEVARGDALGNALRAGEFDWTRRIEKIGTPVDPAEWRMTPPTVNAYYSPAQNNINFPAGILQPPFFDREMDDAVNFGAIGAVIGHELTHGFDDQGRKFDARGNLSDWWTAEDAREFEKRAECFVRQYAEYEGAPGVKLNGRLTLGENVADAGGVRLAYMALLAALAGKPAPRIDGFTARQRFFLGWAQVWCQNRTEEYARRQAVTDPHAPGRWRVNGVVSNMPEFAEAFGCRAGDAMVREEPCRVW